MILDLKKVLSCRCPVCSERSYNTVTPFQINGGFTSECTLCGAEFLTVSKTKNGYSFKVSCFICDTSHEFSVSFDGVWHKDLLTLGCPLTGIDLLYIGNKSNVYDAAIESDDIFSEFSEKISDDELINEFPPLFEAAFEIISSRITSNLVTCPCGHTAAALSLSQNGITVICDNCDAKLFIPIASDEDIQNLNNTHIITLK